MKIAIVGTGISGLVAAHLLHPEHELVVYEAGGRVGGHSHTVEVESEGGSHWIDTGFIVFNDRNYPNFERLLDELGVASQPSHMGFSVSDGRDFEYSGTPRGLFARPSHLLSPSFLGMLRDWRRFNREAQTLIGMNGTAPSLGRWLEERGFSRHFVERLIVPQAAAVWSADPEQMWSFPASFMAEFFDNHGMFSLRDRPRWRTVSGGSIRYVKAITAPWRDRIRLRAPVRSIERLDGCVRIEADGCESEDFDEVVIATHSDQALAMLADPSEAEREVLGAIPYQRNEAVLHTDASLLPRRRTAWSSWNFHLSEPASDRSTVTYWMNNLQRLRADREFLLTLNRAEAIDPDKVLRRFTYEHPVYTAAGVRAQSQHAEISGVRRTHYCGAYWGWGFHEDGVLSAIRACERIAPAARARRPEALAA
jgi:predicted NAD/FAD-binding protein